MSYPRIHRVLLLAFVISPLCISTRAQDTHGAGEKCLGGPGRPSVASLPCAPGYECVRDPSPGGWGSTCVELFDCDEGDEFPLEELLIGQTSGYVGCETDDGCPAGAKCEDFPGSAAISGGNVACTRYTQDVGERCDDGSQHRGFVDDDMIQLPSPGCLRERNLTCERLATIPGAPAVCMQLRSEGEACDGVYDWCAVFERNAKKLDCIDGVCKISLFQ